MGYDVHITRKQHWADEEEAATISLAEWLAYVAADPEMRLDNHAEAPVGDTGTTPGVESQGLSVWLPYSKNGRAGNYAWFAHEGDRVTVKNPDEEILGKMLTIAHALGARVQGTDGEYYDEVAPLFANPASSSTGTWADAGLRNFQTFASAGAAEPLLQALAEAGIPYHTTFDTGQVAFDPSFANNQLTSNFTVQLALVDFERGTQLLNKLNQHALSQIDPDHYLFRFTDEELMDIVVKPDEWSALDVALAGQLLRKRGRDVSPDTLQLLRQRRVAELAQPDQDHKSLVRSGYLSAMLGGIIGIVVGYQLYTSRKQLPTGQRVYAYSPTDRVHGIRIMVLGICVFILVMAARLIRLMED
ncbi:hypothetical protein GCM10023172_37230 [Hymenobacter ginsengisoli]|uniref:DUF2167 domain-containing protein n=1 Tax=Hymenobacter ginsengisoli TaxID=1051626 RepID=A0ABP8QNF1_9BACT|nr:MULTISPECIES: hypothetical protein [unclassified Hymenobacter]MBO2032760.1 hypothetical protein [Hymenobacter sp. BT559]